MIDYGNKKTVRPYGSRQTGFPVSEISSCLVFTGTTSGLPLCLSPIHAEVTSNCTSNTPNNCPSAYLRRLLNLLLVY